MPVSVSDPGGRWVLAGSGAAVALSVVGVLVFAPGDAPDQLASQPLASQPSLVPTPPTTLPLAPPMPQPKVADDGSGVLNGMLDDSHQVAPNPEPQPVVNPDPQSGSIDTVQDTPPKRGQRAQPAVDRVPDIAARVDVPPAKVVVVAKPAAAPAKPAPAPAKPAPAPAKPAAKPAAPPAAPAFNPYGPCPYGANPYAAYPNPYGAYPYGGGPMMMYPVSPYYY